MEYVFFILVGLLLYVFAIFPLVLRLTCLFRRAKNPPPFEPTVSILTAARNERQNIAEKIANTFASDYPADKLRMVILSDGSTDGTEDVVRALGNKRVRLITVSPGQGKTSAINTMAQDADGDIMVISDADILIEGKAIRELVKHFSDPAVGAVCGHRSDNETRLSGTGESTRLYNSYESATKKAEGAIGRVIGGDGSLYAMRRSCFRPLPAGVPDDFVNILRVLESGKKVLYEENSFSWEKLSGNGTGEFSRKRRTVARGIRGLLAVSGLLNPFRFPVVFFLILSHKLLRWMAGWMMIALLVISVLLASKPFFLWCLAAQLLFYSAGMILKKGIPFLLPSRLTKIVNYFTMSNLAACVGLVDVIRGKNWDSWKTQRNEPLLPA